MLMVNRNKGLMMTLGEQAIVTEGACEIISHVPRDMSVNG
jgi:hypothetical protein